MKTYIYKGAKDFFYHDTCIAKLGDTLEIGVEGIRNITNKNKFNKATAEIIEDILKECDEYDPEVGIDSDEQDFSEFPSNLNNSNIRSLFSINSDIISRLIVLGILKTEENSCRNYNIG